VSTPEAGSAPTQPIVSPWLYQPFESGARLGAGETTGGVASYLIWLVAEPALPALSVQIPAEAALWPSGPEYDLAALQVSTPEVASVALHEIVTGWLYQPFRSGARSGVAVTLGAVASNLSGNAVEVVFPALSVQAPGTAALALSGPE
jgi:hypothetical protein